MYQLQDLRKRHSYFEDEDFEYPLEYQEETIIEVMIVRLLIRRDELIEKQTK